MTKDEAMQQALEALQESIDVPCYGGHPKQEAAYRALQEVLANEALDKKAENARELGLDYKPAKYSDIVSDGGLDPRNKFDKPAQQEPVAWLSTDSIGERYLCFDKPLDNDSLQPLYSTLPQRPWVGLTDEEALEVMRQVPQLTVEGLLSVEAKLKEKNT